LSPKAERVLFAARGDIFTAPIEKGPTRNLTRSSGSFDKWPSWSPDGSQVAFVSDMSGEEEIYLAPQDGSKPAEQITRGGTAMRYQPEWAPDGKRIAFSDKDGKVYVLTLADRKVTQIADARRGQVRDYSWSPRGNYLAFTMPNENQFSSIYIWSAADNQLRRVTEENVNSFTPAWDPQGNYVYFLSDREFLPQVSSVEFNFATNRTTYIYAMALRKDVKHPFPPESDEVTVAKSDDGPKPAASPAASPSESPAASPEASKPEAAPKPPATLTIDFDGIANRVARAPIAADNYGGLSVKPGHSAKRRRLRKMSAVTCLPTTVRKCSLRKVPRPLFTTSTTRRRQAIVRAKLFRLRDSSSIVFLLKSGNRSSTKCGAVIATGSTCRTCTVLIGSLCASSTSRCSSMSRIVRI
jgi:tricorn protease